MAKGCGCLDHMHRDTAIGTLYQATILYYTPIYAIHYTIANIL